MAARRLLRPRATRTRRLRRHATPGCPLVRNRATWCMGLCTPVDGQGTCGRVAPHGLRGRTQRAIARFNAEKKT
jgi:hypothetical protein